MISNEETLEVYDSILVTRQLRIPEYSYSGKYIFYVKITYKDYIAIGSDIFVVSESNLSQEGKEALFKFILIITIALLIAMALMNISKFIEYASLSKKEFHDWMYKIPKFAKIKATKEAEYENINLKVKAILLSMANLSKRFANFIKRGQASVGKTKKKYSKKEQQEKEQNKQ